MVELECRKNYYIGGIMKYKMFVTDVDDTLLNDNHEITKANKEAIMELQKQGVTFVLASGRPTEAMMKIAKELELDKYNGYVAGYNGGEILDMKTNKVLSRESLTREELLEIYEETKDIDLKFINYKNNFRLLELDNINDNNTLKCYKIS